MSSHENNLRQQNRLLKLGYAALAVFAITGFAFAQGQADPPVHHPDDPNGNRVTVDINKVGDAQTMVGVENPDGFAVLIDEEGKINVIHRDGTVIVPNRKVYSHVYQERHEAGPRLIDIP
ncbi:MAG: hypothetical protein ACIAXF_10030 [Phycisphaerales bacterium JB063]